MSFTSNITISKDDPAVLYNASESLVAYHEDHEIAGIMYRASNAKYNETPENNWSSVDNSQPSYATVQNPDGSTGYLSHPATSYTWITAEWEGSQNNTVYNAVDYGMSTGDLTGSDNQMALQNAVTAAITAGGGTVVIPAGTYYIKGTVTLSGVTGGLLIRGESSRTFLYQQEAYDTFDVTMSGSTSNRGIRFRDLTIKYVDGLSPQGGVAINCSLDASDSVANVTVEDCAFIDCPQAFAAGSSGNALHCGLLNCTVFQSANGYSNSTQILLGGPECFVIACDIYQYPMSDEGGGPTGCTGIEIRGPSNSTAQGCRVHGCHIANFYWGIWIKDNSKFIALTACEIDAAVALNILPGANGNIYGVFVTACKFGMISYEPLAPTSGVFIDTAGGDNTNVEGIFIADCQAYGYGNAGMLIIRGQSIHVNGGKYSSNGTAPLAPIDGAGVAITGSCDQVRITGADCSGVFDFLAPSPPVQPYGVSVYDGASNVLVADCDLTGNATKPIYVPTSGTDVRVVNCVGYNDQGTLLSAPIPSGTFYNYTFNGYYGPITFYVSGGVSSNRVTIGSLNTGLATGAFYLPCKVGASVTYSGSPTPIFGVVGM